MIIHTDQSIQGGDIYDNKKDLLFKNLPSLLKDMEDKEWIIDSFPFKYKEKIT